MMPWMIRFALLLVVCAATASAQSSGDGQPCTIDIIGNPDSTTFYRQTTPTGKTMAFWGRGIKAKCAGTDMVVSADSAESLEDAGLMTLIGRAHYTEKGTTIDADRMQYFERDAHLLAVGNAHASTKSKSTLRADQLTYYRIMPGIRTFTMADAIGSRPHAELRDSVGAKDTSLTLIDADRLHMERDSVFYAGGKVVVTRTDLITTSDSAFIDTGKRFSRLLLGSPRIEGRGDKKFTLEGNVLDIFGKERDIDSVYAKGRAVAVNDSLKLTSDTLHLRMTAGKISHVLAWGPKRAHATSPERDIEANWLSISMPGGQVRDLDAYGKARVETKADSLVHSKDRNWIEGDTVHATFEKPAAGDTTTQPPLHSLVSRVNARSYYQVPPKEHTDTAFAIDYVHGPRIDVAFVKGAVTDVHVTGGNVNGLHLDPVKDSTKTPAKTAPARKPPAKAPPPRKPPPPHLP